MTLNRILRVTVAISAAVLISACTNANRFNDDAADVGLGNTGIDPSATAGSLDPTSPAYFSTTIGDRVLFAVDESTLGGEARGILGQQAGWLNTNTQYSVQIEGHADEQGTREYNLALGARRASAVQQYLISQGVAPNRVRTVSFGKERPIEICSEESCYSQNRRAVTVVAGGAS